VKVKSPLNWFGTWTRGGPGLNLLRLEENLSAVHLRLSHVLIESLPYHDFLDRYDREHTWFYIDPPYWDCESDYGKGLFGKPDFTRIATKMASMKGKATMSINGAPEIREIFKAFRMETVSTRYSVGQRVNADGDIKELLFHNFDAKTPKMWK
jgi:DNA adenine methylase